MDRRSIVLAAGGTGGHLFPAEALAQTLIQRGWSVHLATDDRARRYADRFPAEQVHIIPSATLASKNPVAMASTFWTLWRGFRVASTILHKVKPAAVVGFGGYPTLPPVFAATRRAIPTLIHEQNAVMGRANRALATRVQAIAGGFLDDGAGPMASKTVITGNPVRTSVLEAAGHGYQPSLADEPFNLLVFGGSQGASFFSDCVPLAVADLAEELRTRLRVVQQVRKDEVHGVRNAYAELGIAAEIAPFFENMADHMAKAHLVLSRSGASTVSEIAVIGRPALLVPYPYALDHDQSANAAALASGGGAEIHLQDTLSPQVLSELIAEMAGKPERLSSMAKAAKMAGRPNAAGLLADLAEAIANGDSVSSYKERLNS